MIISDSHRFVFVHIPKCAGTSIRRRLLCFDDRNKFYAGVLTRSPSLGSLDYAHIPLFFLREHFLSDFEKVMEYHSCAVIREPYDRFSSSVSQRLRSYSDTPIQARSVGEVKSAIEESISFLAKTMNFETLLPAEYVHFQKQTDYTHLEGLQIVDKIYTIEHVSQLLLDLSECVGEDLQAMVQKNNMIQENRTLVHRNTIIRGIVESTRPATSVITDALPVSLKEKLRSLLYVPRDSGLKALFASDYVTDFIRDYYEDDIALWENVNQMDSLTSDEHANEV